MRKKRKLQARADQAAAIAEELVTTPEIAEAIEGAELAAEHDAEATAEARAALLGVLAGAAGAIETASDAEAADAEADPAAIWTEDAEAGEADPAAGEPGEAVGPALMTAERLAGVVESLLFAADKPLALRDLRALVRIRDLKLVEAALEAVRARHTGGGIVLHEVAGGFQFRTAPENSGYVQQLIAGRPVRLSRAQLETLAIIAYRQPITRPEIDEIRGVDTSSTLKVLMDRDLVRVLGKKEEPGRPLIFGTTREFLEFFHLKDLREMPTLREFHELSEDSLREVARLDDEGDDGAGPAGDRSTEPDEPSATDHTVAVAEGAETTAPLHGDDDGDERSAEDHS